MTEKNVSSKITSYAKAHISELRAFEKKQGKKLSKEDVAIFMMQKGALTQGEYNIWYSTNESFHSRSAKWNAGGLFAQNEVKSYLDDFQTETKNDLSKDRFNYMPKKKTAREINEMQARENAKASQAKKLGKKYTPIDVSQKFDYKDIIEKDKFQQHLRELPPVKASYTELMRGIKFKNASKEEQIDMMLQEAGERFQIARKQGNKSEMKKLLFDGLSLAFQKMDSALGITRVKEDTKEFYGLNALVDKVNELVDDGDETNLTFMEKAWEVVKGVGDAADSFIGTQGVATIGTFAALSTAAVSSATAVGGARAGQVVTGLIQGYFGYEGGSLVIDGTKDVVTADTKEQVRQGGAKIGMGGVMLYGTYQTFKAGYQAYKANQLELKEQEALRQSACELLEIPEGTEITETVLKEAYRKASLKSHPDRGGSTEVFDAVNNAYQLLKENLKTSTASAGVNEGVNEGVNASAPKTTSAPKEAPAQNTKSATLPAELESQIARAAQTAEYDASVVLDLMKTHPDVVNTLASCKGPDGEPLFNVQDISDVLFNCKSTIENNPQKITVILKNPEEVAHISKYRSRGAGLWRATGDPLSSTINANPEIFGVKPKTAAAPKEAPVQTVSKTSIQAQPSTYRAKLATPDYSKTRQNFPADAFQSQSKPGKATAYTTNSEPDGIVYKGKDGKLYVPNKWDPEHPYEVNTGADGKPASVIMIYDEAAGDFAVGEPNTIASTYKNPATGELDPLYDLAPGKSNAINIEKDVVPSAYKIVEPGTKITTKEGPRVVQDDEVVVYDIDGDPYVMPKKNFLKRQEPLNSDAKSVELYNKIKAGEPLPEGVVSKSGNATSPNALTYKLPEVVDELTLSNSDRALLYSRGNGKISDVQPEIAEKVTEFLSKRFGKQISPDDLIVITTSKGSSLAWYNPETKLSTAFTYSGEPNGQWEIEFENNKPTDYGVATIYTKFPDGHYDFMLK